ncbi:sulfatase [Natrinema sp. 74]|uniref:sulfatase n=1 Tax=Natrinema sp. 74 TaxID=3384159 RepID=UPI0038D3DD9C
MTAADCSRPNVLLLVVDACRADALEPYGDSAFGSDGSRAAGGPATADTVSAPETPAASALADEGTVFRHAISPAPWTLPSASSLLTGLDPDEHGATSRRFAIDRGRPLQRDLSAAGYRTIHISPTTWIGDWLPQGAGFDRVDEFTGPRHRYFDGGCDVRDLSRGVARGPEWYATVLRRALASDAPLRSLGNAAAFAAAEATGDAWLDDVRASERAARLADERFAEAADGDRPFFAYVHLMDPHLPFYVPEPFRTDSVRPPGCDDYADELEYMDALMGDIWAIRTGDRTLTPDEQTSLRTRYADAVHYADRVIGRILERLRERGLADETLVALTGDHGEHLGERVTEPGSGGGSGRAGDRTLLDHQASIRLPLLRVPLIVRYPGVFEGNERGDLVQPHYLAETVRGLVGLEYDSSRSLLPGDEPRPVARASYEGVVRSHPPDGVPTEALFRPRKTAIAGEWKLDRVGEDPSTDRARRIDWTATDTHPVSLEAVPDRVRARLEETLATIEESESTEIGTETDGTGTDDGTGKRDVPAAVDERLSQLGYR